MDFPDISLFLVLLISVISTTFSQHIITKVNGECTKQQVTGKVVIISRIQFKECNQTIKLLKIFAEEKVIFDRDLNFYGMKTQLVIIAPIWEVIGSRSIILNGHDAEGYYKPANNGNETGNRNGEDGLAGLPGGSAGNFYGIADEIINAHLLDITAIGGVGGKGQDGGNGANGANGRAGNNREYDCETRKVPGHKTSQTGNDYLVYGEYGASGGRGGNGGARGLGGLRGIIDIIHFSKQNGVESVYTVVSAGANGHHGIGGKGGIGGKRGETGRGYCCKIYGVWSRSFYGYWIYDGSLRINGLDGFIDESLKKRQMPKPSIVIENFPQVINEYKNYIRPKLADPNIRNSKMHSLYDLLNSRHEVTKLYDSVNLVDEFTNLELEYFISQDRDYLLPSYTQLSERFNEYLTSLSSAHLDERTRNTYRAVLLELEWLIAEKLNTFNESKGHSAMTNITLGLFTNGITPKDNLIEFENTYIRLEAFSNRIAVIDDLIREANELINDDLKNVMQDLQDTLNSKINKILQEITILVKDNRNTEDDLFKKRKELKEAIFLKGVFSVLKAGSAIAATVYPPLGVAAAVGSSALSVAESLIPEVDASPQIKKVTKAEKMLAKSAKKFLQNADANHQEVFINSRITEMTRNMSRSEKSDVEKLKNDIIKKLKKADEDEETKSYKSFEWDKSFIDDITKELQEAKKDEDIVKENTSKVKLNVVKLFKVTNIVASTASLALKNNLQDQKKVDEMNDALEQNNVNLKRLYVIEEGIYSQTEPMLENMFSDIHQMGHNMSRMSVNQKLIANWNVINTLEDVQQKINSTLSTFEASEEINFVFKKLFSTFNVITKLHDVITRKLDEIADASFLVTLHMPQQSRTLTVNNKLAWSLAKLNKIYHQNYLQDEYKDWIHAFKQFSFPNGGYYLRRTNYPDSVLNKNIDEFISKIVFNIKSFNNYFNTEDGMDNFLENQIVESYRGTCSNNKRAFFAWKNEENREAITDILKGKRVTLVSRGLDSETDSLKFNKIGIVFTSKDPTTQERLFSILSNFKVNLTHSGDSVYSFSNKNYVIQTNPVDLIFYYPASVNEIAGTSSPMHRKFSSGDCILSPFATWTVELLPVGRNSFGLLEEFIGKVDLELIGEGQRFKSNGCNKMCQDLIEKTYKHLV